MGALTKLKAWVTLLGGHFWNWLLLGLSIIAVMNVVYISGYREPFDGATWEMEDGRLTAVSVDLEVTSSFQIGDILLTIDDEKISDKSDYQELLYSQEIGSKHLYSIDRSGDIYEPFVTLRGKKVQSHRSYFPFAFTGLVYLAFLFLVLTQNLSFGSKRALLLLCFFVFLRFSFNFTPRFNTLDWIAFYLDIIGAVLLPSALVAVAIIQTFARTRWRPFIQGLHWIPTLLLLTLKLLWLVVTASYGRPLFGEDFLSKLDRIQALWGGSLVMFSILLLALVAEIRARKKSFSFYWAIAWLPFALWLWGVNYPFLKTVAALAPLVFPIALLVEWSRKGALYLGEIAKKSLVYFVAIFILLGGYALFIITFQALLGSKVSPTTHTTILAIGIIFSTFSISPLKHYAAEVLDRLIYGQRYDSIQLLSDFGNLNRADTKIEEFFNIVLDRIKQAFGTEHAVAYQMGENTKIFKTLDSMKVHRTFVFEELEPDLLDGDIIRGHRTKAVTLDATKKNPFSASDYICPIRVAGELSALIVFKLEDNRSLSPEEERLLKGFFHQCDVHLENMELYHAVNQKALSITQLKEYNENIIESSRMGILTTDEMGRLVSCNHAISELVGKSKDQMMGKNFEELLTPLKKGNQRQIKSGFTTEGIFQSATGDELTLEIQKTPLKTKENEVYGTLYLVEDIEEKKKFNEKLMQQEKLASIGLLAAGVAHEINTPLTGIASYSQLLTNEPTLSKDQLEMLNLIQEQSRRAAKIVSELLNFSRKEPAPKGPVDLMVVLNQTLRFLSHQIQKSKTAVTVHEPNEEPIIEGYANQLQQIFLNLIVNALDAMPEGGTLDISLTCSRRHIEMSFQDSGVGMDLKTRSRIFDPFFTTKELGKGTGLGLSVVYTILQEHGASAEVESELQKGCKFTLHFPKKPKSDRDGRSKTSSPLLKEAG